MTARGNLGRWALRAFALGYLAVLLLILLNPAATPITGTVEFSASVATDRGTNTTFPYVIPPSGTWTLKTTGTRQDALTGFASIAENRSRSTPW